MSRGTSGSQCPPPPAPRAHPQHAALAANARCPVLVARLDGFGAVDHIRAVHEDLGSGLHRDELRARASERGITAREPTLRPRTGSHLLAPSRIRPRQPTAWALGLAGREEKRGCQAPTTPIWAWLTTKGLCALNLGGRKESQARAWCALPRCAPTRQPMSDGHRQGGGACLGEGPLGGGLRAVWLAVPPAPNPPSRSTGLHGLAQRRRQAGQV